VLLGRSLSSSSGRLAASLLVVAGVMAACGSHHAKTAAAPPPPPPSTVTTTSTTVAPTTTTVRKVATCPLTGAPAPQGKVPARPALAIKVENLPVSRPPYGLATADVVYEEPVEGGITRFIVIYQCHDADRVEPVRSGRLIDPDIVSQYGSHPLFAYSGAIQPVITKVDSSSLIDVGANQAPNAYWRDAARYGPHNLATSTGVLYAAGVAHRAPPVPPAPVFSYGALDTTAVPAASVQIPYLYSDVTWAWQPAKHYWLRSYSDTGLATLGAGGAIATKNVVVMKVVLYPSPYVEDVTGTHENLLVLTGSGPAQIFRDGKMVAGTWRRPTLDQKTQFVDGHGHVIALDPGQTWVELVPTTIGVTVTP
jgi:Protein of unknown function (DUF3048) N-terminal domain/Protein of unknown function (DUF3048) C-terminal domain